MYTRQQFGKDLKEKVLIREDIVKIARWAYSIYLDKDVDREFKSMLLVLNYMEEGAEFEFSYEELDKIADDLIAGKEVKL